MRHEILLKDAFDENDKAQIKQLLQHDITVLGELSLYTLQKSSFAQMLALVLRGETALTLNALKYLHYTNVEKCMCYWSNERKNDIDFMGQVIERFAFVLRQAGPNVRNDKNIVATAFKDYYGYLEEASDTLRHDIPFIVSLLPHVPDHNMNTLLQFCPKPLQDNKDFVMHFVKRNGYSLYYVSDRLKKDMDVVCASVKNNYSSISYAHHEIFDNIHYVEKILNINPKCFASFPESARGDYAIALYAVEKDIHNVHCLPSALQKEIGNNKTAQYLRQKIEYLKALEFKEELDAVLPTNQITSKRVKI